MVGPPADANNQMAAFYLGGHIMKCVKCNTENKETDTKCKKCGQLLSKQKPNVAGGYSYNWFPALIVICFFIIIILTLKFLFKY